MGEPGDVANLRTETSEQKVPPRKAKANKNRDEESTNSGDPDRGVEYPQPEVGQSVVILIAKLQFTDRDVRHKFIRKVYLLLLVQILITATTTGIFLYVPPLKQFVYENAWLTYVAYALLLVLYIVIICCESVRRTVPVNFFALITFDLIMGFVLGVISAHYTFYSILLSTAITFSVFLALTLFALQTKWDFTLCGGFLVSLSLGLLIMAIFMIFFRHIFPILQIVYATLLGVLICFYIVYDTQIMMGGRHSYALSPEEYIFASFNLYVDLVFLFCMVLSCCGTRQ